MSTLFLRTLGLVLLLSVVNAKPTGLQGRAASIDASSIDGKFLFGYQGFFRRPGQGNDHWSINYGEIPGPSNLGAGEFISISVESVGFVMSHATITCIDNG